ncbi:hypothetical protein KP509_05G025900 [Ceratopteris richardii]|nr:hypothetical protein KP509_05G025900 [Ceratopteris richardii]
MLYNAYKNVLEKDPSSAQIIERLMDMHKAGDCDTGVLLQHLGHHLDACAGSIDVWRKLSACFLKLKECDSTHSKENMDSSNDGFVHTCDFDFLQCESAREEWKLRERWWAGKHFYHGDIEVELNSRGMLWLLFKAAGAAHIYGPDTLYVSEAERVLQVIGSQSGLERLQMHKRNSFNLLSRFRLSTYRGSTL